MVSEFWVVLHCQLIYWNTVCEQQQYSLLCRDSEMEAFQVCKIEGVGVLPWSPLKGYVHTFSYMPSVKPIQASKFVLFECQILIAKNF